MKEYQESGIEKLRALVDVAGWCSEWAFDDIPDVASTIRLLEACLALDFETLPDDLLASERKHAAKTGTVSRSTIARLYRLEHGSKWEANLVGKDRALYDSLKR